MIVSLEETHNLGNMESNEDYVTYISKWVENFLIESFFINMI